MSMQELFAEASQAFPAGLSAVEQTMRLDAYYTLPDDYLQKVDVASMAFSLEAREPLLDQDVVEWAMKLPLKWKIAGRQNKYLLRKLAYRYVPQEVLDRPKQGFEVPVADWLRGSLREWSIERINDARSFEESPLQSSQLKDLFHKHDSGARNAHPLLWAALMFMDFSRRASEQEVRSASVVHNAC
jgi:asparagine synthase (glutamine-hydrolysing)